MPNNCCLAVKICLQSRPFLYSAFWEQTPLQLFVVAGFTSDAIWFYTILLTFLYIHWILYTLNTPKFVEVKKYFKWFSHFAHFWANGHTMNMSAPETFIQQYIDDCMQISSITCTRIRGIRDQIQWRSVPPVMIITIIMVMPMVVAVVLCAVRFWFITMIWKIIGKSTLLQVLPTTNLAQNRCVVHLLFRHWC